MRAKTDLEPAWSNTPYKQIQLLSRIKTLYRPRVRGISPVGKEKVYDRQDLLKCQVLSSVTEHASGDSDGKGNELPCVIGESEGDCI